MTKSAIFALATLMLAVPAIAQDPERTERVQFQRGSSSKAIKGSLKGYAVTSYLVNARGGQKLTVVLKTSNASSYFNVIAPGAEVVVFTGSVSGNSFSTDIPSTGDYRIQVYLMRNAAHRNEVANYTLTIGVR